MRNAKNGRLSLTRLTALLLAVLLAAALAGCQKAEPAETQPQDVIVQTTASEASDIPEEEIAPIEIETPYGTLLYPGEWAEGLRTEISGEDFDTAVAFYGSVDSEEYLLFTVHFGGAAGFPVGVLQMEDGVMLDVTADMADLALKDSWTAEESDRICAMQEAMNYVVEKLNDMPGFSPAE